MIKNKEEYLSSLNEIELSWVNEFIDYIDTNYQFLTITIFRQLPMYKFYDSYLKGYILLSTNKNEFVIHTLYFDIIENMKNILPNAKFGKGCVKVKFKDIYAKPYLKQMIDTIIIKYKKQDLLL